MTRSEIDRAIRRLERQRHAGHPLSPGRLERARKINARITVLRIARAASC